MKTLKNIKQNGGRKIGRGAYSCVIKPALQCPTSTKKNMTNKISKIIKKDSFKKSNKKINTILKKIDTDQVYLIYYDKYCKANTNSIKNRKYRDIKVVKDYETEDESDVISDLITIEDTNCIIKPDNKYINIIETYGGETIYNIFLHNKKVKSVYKVVLKLLQGLKLLHDNNIVHRDIKIDNIVVDNDNVRYIDFNVSKITTDMPDKYITLVGNFKYNISLDYIILYYLHLLIKYKGYKFGNKLIKTINTICHKKYKSYIETLNEIHLSYSAILSNTSINSTDSMANIYIREFDENRFVGLIRFMYKVYKKRNFAKYYKTDYIYKNDIYGLGIIFKMFIIKNKLDIKNNDNARKLAVLANNMININPLKRYSINECLDFWLDNQ